MRWHIIRVLLHKEVLRQLANRGGLALAALLVVAALLMSLFSKNGGAPGVLGGGLERCFVDYWHEDDWLRHLRDHVPAELSRRIRFRYLPGLAESLTTRGGQLVYPPGSGAIQIRQRTLGDGRRVPHVVFWHAGDAGSLAPYEAWFWRETARYCERQAARAGLDAPRIHHEYMALTGTADMRSSVTTGLVLFALFFACVYLMPSLMCEERERGILLAQALSPASALEILTAKFLFYPAAGMALAALLAGIANPAVLAEPLFWLALAAAALGALGIGLTIASLARTQRTASMGALCYMLVVALFLFICQQGNIPGLPYLAVEYHCPRILHAALGGAVAWYHWGNLIAAAVLAVSWSAVAVVLFRKRGWQ